MLNPDYVSGGANWTQGLAVGTFSTKSENFDVQLIPACGRGFIFNGNHYGNTEMEADIWSPAKATISNDALNINLVFGELTPSR
jgi:hypothetical protein